MAADNLMSFHTFEILYPELVFMKDTSATTCYGCNPHPHHMTYQNGLQKQIMATPKLTHVRSNKRYRVIFASFLAFLDIASPNNCHIYC